MMNKKGVTVLIKKRNAKGFFSLVLTVIILCMSVMPCLATVDYPENVTKEQALFYPLSSVAINTCCMLNDFSGPFNPICTSLVCAG